MNSLLILDFPRPNGDISQINTDALKLEPSASKICEIRIILFIPSPNGDISLINAIRERAKFSASETLEPQQCTDTAP